MLGIIQKINMALFINIANASNHTECVSLSNQKCMIQPTLINLHPNEYSHESHYYPYSVKLDRFVGDCNTLNHLFNKVCNPNKTEDLNLTVFNMIKVINEAKTLPKHISCECKCNFDGTKCKSNQWWNNDKCRCECKKDHICEKDYVWYPSTCSCEKGKYLAIIMDDSTIICDESYAKLSAKDDDEKINFSEKKAICKTQNFYILLVFLLIIITLLIAVTIYCCLMKYQRKHLLPFHNNNNELNKFYIDSVN